jgi:hypothetical protein
VHYYRNTFAQLVGEICSKCHSAQSGDSVVFALGNNYSQHQQAQDSLVVLARNFVGDDGHDYIEN